MPIFKKWIFIILIAVVGVSGIFVFWKTRSSSSPTETTLPEKKSEELLGISGREEEPEPPIPSHQGSFKLTTDPDGAHVVIQYGGETFEGETPFSIPSLSFQGSEIEITAQVSKPAYVSETLYFLLTSESPQGEFHVSLFQAEKARLSVQAVPWGRVGIDQKETLQETPLLNYPVSPGRHTVFVFHPPTGEWLEASVSLDSANHVRCIARFGGDSRLACR